MSFASSGLQFLFFWWDSSWGNGKDWSLHPHRKQSLGLDRASDLFPGRGAYGVFNDIITLRAQTQGHQWGMKL